MGKIFLIAGLGADTRVYTGIDFGDYEVVHVNWLEPHKKDTLTTYTQKLVLQYHITPNSIIIGNSFGGMAAIEIAKQIPLEKVILISSIKTIHERSWYFPLFRIFPVYKLMPFKLLVFASCTIKRLFLNANANDLRLFRDMLLQSPPIFVKWAMGAALNWDNEVAPANLYQVIGDQDFVFSHKKTKDAFVIKGGVHNMLLTHKKEVNAYLKGVLK